MSRRRQPGAIDFGRRVKQWREHVGLSRVELAGRLGVCPDSVERWEAGARWPEARHVQALKQMMADADLPPLEPEPELVLAPKPKPAWRPYDPFGRVAW